jgi:recombination associated protein RdgC
LDGKEVKQHLQTGKQVARLGLNWRDRIAFVLTDRLQVKRVEYLQVKEQAEGEEQALAADLFDADFALMAGELSLMLNNLTECLGGLQLMLGDAKAAA